MNPDLFWTSDDGIITSCRDVKDSNTLQLTITFKLRNKAEIQHAREYRRQIKFTERSTIARLGIEITAPKPPRLNKDRMILTGEAHVYDANFPCLPFFRDLLKPGTPVGRLFYAPGSQKLSSGEIWKALQENLIKLPNTTSIDRFGRVFMTPHRVRYTMPHSMTPIDHMRVIRGMHPRSYLDKAQIREEIDVASIPPKSGLLTSVSMYLKEHYVILNTGEGNFGLHTAAVLLDPIKTFGSNIVLEIYNSSEQPVINPVVSIEVYHAPKYDRIEKEQITERNKVFFSGLRELYRHLDENPNAHFSNMRPTTNVSISGRSARTENLSLLYYRSREIGEEVRRIESDRHFGYRTISQAIRRGDPKSDTLVLEHFPSVPEHVEILARFRMLKIKNIVFRKANTMQDFFLPAEAHSMLDTYQEMGLKVYWFNADLDQLYVHVYKKNLGFFIKEELAERFLASTIIAFYGSALDMDKRQTQQIRELVIRMTNFFGSNVGILTGGGDGVMGLATEVAREQTCLTGAAFLELEAQPPKVGVDFFNTFQEENRHNRQKWFQVADFCIFNLGGVGTLEEIGIELCNLKLGIRPRVPFIFYHSDYWSHLESQVRQMASDHRMPSWMQDYLLFSNNPDEITEFYRKTLQIL